MSFLFEFYNMKMAEKKLLKMRLDLHVVIHFFVEQNLYYTHFDWKIYGTNVFDTLITTQLIQKTVKMKKTELFNQKQNYETLNV